MKGITVILHLKEAAAEDAFGAPVYEERTIEVDNVLVGEPLENDIINDQNLYGKHLAYTLAIPKGDNNDWTDAEVEFFGQKFRTYGDVMQGMDHLIPLAWNKKVRVERYG